MEEGPSSLDACMESAVCQMDRVSNVAHSRSLIREILKNRKTSGLEYHNQLNFVGLKTCRIFIKKKLQVVFDS
jgi:hypothetical protein